MIIQFLAPGLLLGGDQIAIGFLEYILLLSIRNDPDTIWEGAVRPSGITQGGRNGPPIFYASVHGKVNRRGNDDDSNRIHGYRRNPDSLWPDTGLTGRRSGGLSGTGIILQKLRTPDLQLPVASQVQNPAHRILCIARHDNSVSFPPGLRHNGLQFPVLEKIPLEYGLSLVLDTGAIIADGAVKSQIPGIRNRVCRVNDRRFQLSGAFPQPMVG